MERVDGRGGTALDDVGTGPGDDVSERSLRGRGRWIVAAAVVVLTLAAGLAWRSARNSRESLRQTLLTRVTTADPGMVAPALGRLVVEFGEPPERLLDRLHAGASFRLDVLRRLDRAAFGSRRAFGYMTYLLSDVAARNEALRVEALALRDSVRAAFLEASGLVPPNTADDTTLNRRVRIPGGAFLMGDDTATGLAYGRGFSGRQSPARLVTLDAFSIHEHEVTNQEYRRFNPDQRCPGQPRQPAVCVTWYDAMAYGAWLGGALPTEAQWERTARGTEGRTYPWGNADPSCELSFYAECLVKDRPEGIRGLASDGRAWLSDRLGLYRPSDARSVMSRPAGATAEGVYDLSGNAWEWVSNWFGFYEAADTLDPRGPETGTWRGLRGGAYLQSAQRGSYRLGYDPTTNYGVSGFRVAWPEGSD